MKRFQGERAANLSTGGCLSGGCDIARVRNPGRGVRGYMVVARNGKSKSPPCRTKRDKGGAPSSSEILGLGVLGLGWSAGAHALGVEDESFRFGFCSLRLDLFAIPEEADAGGVADPDYQLARGVEGRCGGRDQSFLGDQLSVGGDGDPGVFGGAHD